MITHRCRVFAVCLWTQQTTKVHRISTNGHNIQCHFRTFMWCPYNVSPKIICLWTSMRYHCKCVITSLRDITRTSTNLHFSLHWEFAFIAWCTYRGPSHTKCVLVQISPHPRLSSSKIFSGLFVTHILNEERVVIWFGIWAKSGLPLCLIRELDSIF